MDQSCTACGTTFLVSDEDLAFYDSVSPTFAGKKYPVPPPTHCPDCRQQRRLAVCNEVNFYQGTCGLCKKRTLTEHPPHANRTIYCRSCFYGDGWDPRTYGRDVDFSRSFLDQIKELRAEVPAMALLTEGTNENSEYIHYAGYAKNCYLIMHADYCEDCYYGYGFKHNTSCCDGFYNLSCELCYDCIDCLKCYGLKASQECTNCSSSAFLRDCIGCQSCFLCTGLRDKQFCFENEQLSKEDYEAKIASIDLGAYEQYQKCKARRKELELKHTFKEFQGHNLQNSSGDHLNDCKDTNSCFDCEDTEGCKFCYQVVTGAKNNYDIYQYGLNLQESYECSIAGLESYHALFSHHVHVSCADVLYCWYVHSSKNLFGCVCMPNQSYCILNKQYEKEEYEELAGKIVEHMQKSGEWGEFFPMDFSPFGYNKTPAQMYYPLSEADAKAKGLYWDNEPDPPPEVDKIIPAAKLPDHISDIPDDVLNWAIECEVTKKPFKITPQELRFYREQQIPMPRRNWVQRHFDRYAQRNPRQFFQRQCAQCSKEIQTTWSPERPEQVLCEQCYQKAVY